MQKKVLGFVLGVVLVAGLVPSSSFADHCFNNQIIITTGAAGVDNPVSAGGANPKTLGLLEFPDSSCISQGKVLPDGHIPGTVNTAYITPGSTLFQVRITNLPADLAPTTPTLQYGSGAQVALSLSYKPVYQSWFSSVITIPSSATKITVRAKICADTNGCITNNPTTASRVATKRA